MVIFVLILSCQSKTQKIKTQLEQFIGKTIVFPDSMTIIKLDTINTILPYYQEAEFTISTAIDGACGVCVDQLNDWKTFIQSNATILDKKVKILFFIESYDFDTFEYLTKDIDFSYPLIFDPKELYIWNNKLPQDKRFQTFLLDKNNKILLIGSPIDNNKISELYKKTIVQSK